MQSWLRPDTRRSAKFTHILSIGIGGSAIGPIIVADALGNPGADPLEIDFIDNTDPNGLARTLGKLASRLPATLCIVTSKSGSTPEPRNGMLLVGEAFRSKGLDFAKQAVAITMPGSQLDQTAAAQGWLARFPMFDWIGGRTSVLSAVGLVPCGSYRDWTSTVCSPALPPATRPPAATTCGATPRPSWPSCGITPLAAKA